MGRLLNEVRPQFLLLLAFDCISCPRPLLWFLLGQTVGLFEVHGVQSTSSFKKLSLVELVFDFALDLFPVVAAPVLDSASVVVELLYFSISNKSAFFVVILISVFGVFNGWTFHDFDVICHF